MEETHILIIRFNNKISQREIPFFRGAVIHAMNDADVLFHNHQGDGFRYSYPLIQYKRINQCAAIFCIEQGTEVIGDFFSETNFSFHIGERKVQMEISSIKASQQIIQLWETTFFYSLRKWLPFNSHNFEEYKKITCLTDKIVFLERILTGNILSLCKGLNYFLDQRLECHIVKISDESLVKSKDVKITCMDIEFTSNISLPDFIGIGKHTSIGYGMLTLKRTVKKEF